VLLLIPELALAQSSPFMTGATALQTNILAWLTPIAVILVMVLGAMAMANRMLPFGVIRHLASLKRIDLLIHVSAMDLQRNWGRYIQQARSPLDEFAPGWREAVDLAQSEESARLQFVQYWVGLLKNLGFEGEVRFELITGSKNQPLYWLVLVAKNEIATKFWKSAAQYGKTQQMF
jgi:three-Cys-motif partner protein